MNNALVTILGAGAAGIGMATTLKRLGIEDIQVIDKGQVGASFRKWPSSTHFISPSFNTNGFGFPDLNAITPDTSPGYFSNNEHPSGKMYAAYLTEVAQHFNLPIYTNEEIKEILYTKDGYLLASNHEVYKSKYLIIALGDFHFPNINGIKGGELGIHYTGLGDYSKLTDTDTYAIIGGNESGFDAAINLAKNKKKSIIYTDSTGIDSTSSDPSLGLSIYTRNRYEEFKDWIQIQRGVRIQNIIKSEQGYQMVDSNNNIYHSIAQPILATGFATIQSPLIKHLFEESNQRPVLNHIDESTIYPNLFMVGPQVEHEGVILCYIYKYRQRFAVIADEIAARENIDLDQDMLQYYIDNQMYLDDLSDCGTDCGC